MKKLLLLFTVAMLLFAGCSQFDDSRIWDAIDELEDRVDDLEDACEKMNTNIEALQTLVGALQNSDTIKSIAPIKQGDKVVGYTITFTKSEPITIYHGNDGKDGQNGQNGADGKDGKDGYTPVIGVAQDSDMVYYWTLDGEWLLDQNGNKIKANGTDGKDGQDGANGTDGANGSNGEDGADGITPQLEIRDGYWYISYDNGRSWVELGKATGEDGKDGQNGADGENGKDGDSLFESVTWDEEYAYFTLSDGTVIKIPLSEGAVSEVLDVNINHFYAEYYGDEDGIYTYAVVLSDVYDYANDSFDKEDGNANLYMFFLFSDSGPMANTNALPNGTYRFDTNDSGEVNTICTGEGDLWTGMRNWESYYYDGIEGIVTISDNKLEATFTLENGERHHVLREGSLAVYVEPEKEVVTSTPPNNQIWYTSVNGKPIELSIDGSWNINIISNTYENGLGIITFDGDVTSIAEYAFYSAMYDLESISLPASVIEIKKSAFKHCVGLISIVLPDGLISIGEDAFYECHELAKISIPESVTEIGKGAFYSCAIENITIPSGIKMIDEYVFCYCSELDSVVIPEGVTLIGKSAFYDCRELAEVVIPSSVAEIGVGAFGSCVELTSVTLPENLTTIGGSAFAGCETLSNINLPDSVTFIGSDAFAGCLSLPIENNIRYIETYAIEAIDKTLTTYTLRNGTRFIGNTFQYCKQLEIITIPDSVTSIGDEAFCGCLNLASITIPDSVTSIGDEAFCGCSNLASVTIPDSVNVVKYSAFRDCSSLASVTIGNGVTSIWNYAFEGCSSLAEVYCKSTTPPLVNGDIFFDSPSELKIYVPTENIEAYESAFGWSNYASYIVGYDF